jgi:hypothetical protein
MTWRALSINAYQHLMLPSPAMTAHVAVPPAATHPAGPARFTAGGAPPSPGHGPEPDARGTVSP